MVTTSRSTVQIPPFGSVVVHCSLRFGRYRSSHLLPSFLGLVDTHFFC